jgi:uridylate kinase
VLWERDQHWSLSTSFRLLVLANVKDPTGCCTVQSTGEDLSLLWGGGMLARQYCAAGRAITNVLTSEDIDWLGIHATWLNAALLQTIFCDLAPPEILKDCSVFHIPEEPIVIAAGWEPGSSTDYPAVLLAQRYGVETIFKLSNTDYVYDKDPGLYSDARPFARLSWREYCTMILDTWNPGLHVPFDPIAAQQAAELSMNVLYLNGADLDNLEKALDGERRLGTFIGTIIE